MALHPPRNAFSNRPSQEQPILTPIHQQHASQQQQQNIYLNQPLSTPPPPQRPARPTTAEEERREVLTSQDDAPIRGFYQTSSVSRNSSYGSLPPGASPPVPSSNCLRSPSPFSVSAVSLVQTTKGNQQTADRDFSQQAHVLRKKTTATNAPVALGILRALDPPRNELPKLVHEERSIISSGYSDIGHRDREREHPDKKDKWTFWNRDKEKEKERQKPQDRDKERPRDKDRSGEGQNELTRMIGMLPLISIICRLTALVAVLRVFDCDGFRRLGSRNGGL